MNAILISAGSPESFHPLTLSRPLGECVVAGMTLTEAHQRRLREAGFKPVATATGTPMLCLREDAWLAPTLLRELAQASAPMCVTDDTGAALAWIGAPDGPAAGLPRIAGALRLRHPWELLTVHEELMQAVTASRIEGDLSPAAHIEGTLVLGAGSRILPGVYVEGRVIVGRDCKIGPNCYLRGNTCIGDGCHIGQAVEIKNCIIMDKTAVGHLSYVGDSILGAGVNFGAGTITSNLRHDGKTHRAMAAGKLVDTGRRKFGVIVGDGVHTGIHTAIYPGRQLWPNTTTRPGAVVQQSVIGDQ